MRVCFLEGDMSRAGGTEKMTAIAAGGLAARGYEVTVVSLRMEKGHVFFPLRDGVEHVLLGGRGIPDQIGRLHRLLVRRGADVVVNVDTGMGFYGVLAARGTGARVVTWEHSNFHNDWGSRLFPRLRRFAAGHSDALVVLTERDRKNYTENLRRCAPVHVIPNPQIRREFAYDGQSRTILSAGHLTPVKRFDRAVAAAETVVAEHPGWRWVICGDGPQRAELEQRIRRAGLEGRVILAGTVEDMAAQYRSAAMYVLTSDREGLPMVLLEAKSYGLPIVSFDIETGPSEIVRDGENGFLVPDGDVAALCGGICRLIESPELRQKFSAASQLDMEKFDTERVMDGWEALLKSL